MKALVGAFNQEKALVGAFSVIVQPVVELMDWFAALIRSWEGRGGGEKAGRLRAADSSLLELSRQLDSVEP